MCANSFKDLIWMVLKNGGKLITFLKLFLFVFLICDDVHGKFWIEWKVFESMLYNLNQLEEYLYLYFSIDWSSCCFQNSFVFQKQSLFDVLLQLGCSCKIICDQIIQNQSFDDFILFIWMLSCGYASSVVIEV